MKRMILLSSVAAMALLGSIAVGNAQQQPGAAEKGASGGTMEKAPPAGGGMKGAAPAGEMRSGRSSDAAPAGNAGMKTKGMGGTEAHPKNASEMGKSPGTPMENQHATGEPSQHGATSPATNDRSANGEKGNHDQQGATNAKEPAKPDDHAASGQNKPNGQQGAEAQTKPSTEGRSSTGPTKVTTEESSRLRTVQKNVKVKEAVNINVDVSVGRPVPHTITEYWEPVPEQFVSIMPLWRDYRIVRIHDELLIIDPNTFEIVYVIPG